MIDIKPYIPVFFILIFIWTSCSYNQNVKGVVIDSKTGRPVDSVYVYRYGKFYNYDFTDSNGCFEIIDESAWPFRKNSIKIIFEGFLYQKKLVKLELKKRYRIYIDRVPLYDSIQYINSVQTNKSTDYIRKNSLVSDLGIEHFFVEKDLPEFSCYLISRYFENGKLNTNELFEIGDSLNEKLFKEYTNDYGDFVNGYFLSYQKPIHDFNPITLIQGFGVTESPLVMVLFDDDKKAVNSLVVANEYGEGGGCHESYFINDSTMLHHYEWFEYGYDTITEKDIWDVEYLDQRVIIHSNGEISSKDLKKWSGMQK